MLSIDCGLILDGWQSDSAFTVGVGAISEENRKLIEVTEESFYKGVRKAINGNHLGDIGNAVQTYAESFGYGVIRDLTGHGIGRAMHEEPSVPNFGKPGHGARLRPGMDPGRGADDRHGRLPCGRAGGWLDHRDGGRSDARTTSYHRHQ